ncbi:arylesterase [Aestuariispira ectoiniformans]|uniref:arylesterase n=1 Tax=Aestuariispira ectoiniformans TaxID=2775080 RepID=UPI00223BF975|nr:arylesterase [Aestuariispira ectoiniformans]
MTSRLFNGFALFMLIAALAFPGASQAAEDGDKLILALGDSLTAGYGLPKDDSFPVQLQQALSDKGHKVRVVNAGVSGDTSAGGLSRLEWLLTEKPDLLLLELGANDGLRALAPDDTKTNLATIIEKAKAAEIPVLLTGMLAPPNMGRDYGQAFNAIYPDLAKKYDIVFYPFFLDGVAGDPSLNQGDGMHPTAEGVSIIVDRLLPFVEKALNRKG